MMGNQLATKFLLFMVPLWWLVLAVSACNVSDTAVVQTNQGEQPDVGVDAGDVEEVEDPEDATTEPAPTCDDGLLNGEETDVDCGGPDCPPCAQGQACLGNNDCGVYLVCGDDDLCLCQETRNLADICADASAQCGTVADRCGQTIRCGSCSGNGVCEDNLCVGCTGDDDCASGVCDLATEVCVDCVADGDCEGCRSCSESGFCVSDDDRCEGCQRCSSGTCVDDDAQCPDGVCNGSICFECLVNSDCGTGVCSSNECVPCTNDDHCPGGVCSNNQCVECTHLSHCSDGQVCNASNQCECPTPSCGGAQCGMVTNACGAQIFCGTCSGAHDECTADNQCQCNDQRSVSEICAANLVDCGGTADGCGAAIDCGGCSGGEICHESLCVECVDDDNCGIGEVCANNSCMAVDCVVASDCGVGICTLPGPCESTGSNECTGVSYSHCTEYSCVNNECESQMVEVPQSCDMPQGTVCSLDQQLCIIGQQLACDGSGGCACENIGECNSDADCPQGVCNDDFECVECVGDDDCPSGVCSGHQCVECTTNAHCGLSTCSFGPCVSGQILGDCTGEQTTECTTHSCESNQCQSTTTETTSSCNLAPGTSCVQTCPVGYSGQCDAFGGCACVGGAVDECVYASDCSGAESCCYDIDLGANICTTETSGLLCIL